MENIWEKRSRKTARVQKQILIRNFASMCAVMYRDLHGTRLNPETHGKINAIYILKNFPIVHAIGDRSIE